MELTRESTPIDRDAESPASTFLTPNSKIKALLATLDDNEPVISNASARDQLLASMAKPIPSRLESLDSSEDSDSDNEGAKDFVTLSKSTGRMAARMQVNSKIRESRSEKIELKDKKSTEELPSNISYFSCDGSDSNTDDNDNDKTKSTTPKNKRKRINHYETPNSNNLQKSASPSLFISPRKTQDQSAHTKSLDNNALLVDQHKNAKSTLTQRKRETQLAYETKASMKKSKTTKEQQNVLESIDVGSEADESDGKTEFPLTTQKRSCRKASKKALEDMNRETQRIMRLQQLAHEPITKKKITKESLFSKFNFRPQNEIYPAQQTSSSPVANPNCSETPYTPPTSPVKTRIYDSETNLGTISSPTKDSCKEQETEDIQNSYQTQDTSIISSPPISTPFSKKMSRNGEENVLRTQQLNERGKLNSKLARAHMTEFEKEKECPDDDSDSDLEIIDKKSSLQKRLDHIFDKIPAKKAREANGFFALKILAQLKSPSSEKVEIDKIPISSNQLQISLQQRARQQAAIERKERLDLLKAKGIVIQTSEERERDQTDLDDMLSKARAEAEELAKREKAAKKKERLIDGETNLDDSSEDEDWCENKNVANEELSESDSDHQSADSLSEEEGDDTEFSKEEVLAQRQSATPTATADLHQNNEQNDIENHIDTTDANFDEKESDDESAPLQRPPRRKRDRKIISSDESDDSCEEQGLIQYPRSESKTAVHHSKTPSPEAPTSVLRSATKNFIPGLPVFGPAGLGLTQIFTGTMDSQISNSISSSEQDTEEDGPDTFRKQAPSPPFSLPPSNKYSQSNEKIELSQFSHVSESQVIQFQLSQSQTHGFEGTVEDTQASRFPEPTQDIGFAQLTPIKGRFIESSPKRTDNLDMEIMDENHRKRRKRRLQRRAPQIVSFSDEEKDEQENWQMTTLGLEDDENDIETSVFDVLSKAGKQKNFKKKKTDKKTNEARIMFNEQAEESDDEYAGLGGLSDDQSSSDENDFDRDMIDDDNEKNVDQGEIAAFFANRERDNDEKQLQKLYKDITNGTLRRKRGAEYELSDSDDDGIARQRHKQREFAKMRKALLADERISMIASNPKSQAFLRAIEDRGCSEDEENFLNDAEMQQENQDTQSQSHTEITSQDETTLIGPPSKLKASDDKSSYAMLQPNRDVCQMTAHKKPSNLSEIRHNLSFLLDETDPIKTVDTASESDENLEIVDLESNSEKGYVKKINEEKSDPFALRNNHSAVIDRISLKRNSSASSISNRSHLAYNPKSTSAIGFSVPPLFRKSSSSNTSINSTRSNSNFNCNRVMSKTERETGTENQGIKRGGTWGSGVNYSLRENERCSKIMKTKIRRDQKLLEGARSRKCLLNGLLGAGKFE
ncbi:putative mrc1-like domain-containing protein [Golovinomyces cichoracearum]|uniref:Putative mrc1-like domain-containing protein n=1 Tax=Golovinomyces cichoracearum TaxID=62708 RepID=A0A420I3N7_9PEZI|nr:putative mrc1-like domain-containing protein [Golovinomyces cichoracearum]